MPHRLVDVVAGPVDGGSDVGEREERGERIGGHPVTLATGQVRPTADVVAGDPSSAKSGSRGPLLPREPLAGTGERAGWAAGRVGLTIVVAGAGRRS
ncbi:hypothetical protein Misp04_57830 [Micromonospora sp. NBRC 101691]|nr:hypothetical protein Misp04_57830 [Micromonospora sp. NBRC 101691]